MILKARQTYELGLELMFIAISFAASNMAQITQLQEVKLKDKGEIITKLDENAKGILTITNEAITYLKAEVFRLESEIIGLNQAFNALSVIILCLILAMILLIVLLRVFGYSDSNEPNLLKGIIVPNILGLIAVVLVLSYVYQN